MMELELMQDEDLAFITEVRTEKEIQENLGTFLITSPEKQIEWYKKTKNDPSQMYLIICKDKKQIGYVRFTQIDYINRSICVGADIKAEDRGKGYSKELYENIFDICFNGLNMNRVWLFVLETNKRAIHVYEKMGFKKEGCQRQAIFRNGKHIDYIMMSILKDEFHA